MSIDINKFKKPPEVMVAYDFTIRDDWNVMVRKTDEKYLLCIQVHGFCTLRIPKEATIIIKRQDRKVMYLVSDIKQFKNKNFKAELIFIKWV